MVVMAQVSRPLSDDPSDGNRTLTRAVDRASTWAALMARLRSNAEEREERRHWTPR